MKGDEALGSILGTVAAFAGGLKGMGTLIPRP